MKKTPPMDYFFALVWTVKQSLNDFRKTKETIDHRLDLINADGDGSDGLLQAPGGIGMIDPQTNNFSADFNDICKDLQSAAIKSKTTNPNATWNSYRNKLAQQYAWADIRAQFVSEPIQQENNSDDSRLFWVLGRGLGRVFPRTSHEFDLGTEDLVHRDADERVIIAGRVLPVDRPRPDGIVYRCGAWTAHSHPSLPSAPLHHGVILVVDVQLGHVLDPVIEPTHVLVAVQVAEMLGQVVVHQGIGAVALLGFCGLPSSGGPFLLLESLHVLLAKGLQNLVPAKSILPRL